MSDYRKIYRPGYFGRRRDAIVESLNIKYGAGNWDLVWSTPYQEMTFKDACVHLYQGSYLNFFLEHPDDLDIVCSYGECIDNAMTNIESGLDYTKQEAYSTHIQDIAVRNVLAISGRKFDGPKDRILVIRSADSNGYKYGPGNIPFLVPEWIQSPSKCPSWAKAGSVEDFWQSNKWVAVSSDKEVASENSTGKN